MNAIRLLKKNIAAYKNSMFGRRIPYIPMSKKCLKSLENLPIIYDLIMTLADFTPTFVVLSLPGRLINIDPQKTISIETSQAV